MKYAKPPKRRMMVESIPALFSRRVQKAAIKRMMIVTGIAATVTHFSASEMLLTMTTNCTVKPRKKKKSNFNKAM